MNCYKNLFNRLCATWSIVCLLTTGCISETDTNRYEKNEVFDSSHLSLDQPIWSQNGKLIAFSGFDAVHYESQIFILNTDTFEVKEIYKGPVVSVQDWSSSTSDLIISDYGSIMILSDYNLSKELIRLTSGTVASLSENGNMLAILERKNNNLTIKVWDMEKKKEEILLERENIINAYSISWSFDNKKLLISATVIPAILNVEIYLFDIEKNDFVELTSGVDGEQNLYPTWLDLNRILYLQTNIHNADAYFVIMDMHTACQTKIPFKNASSFSLSPNKQELAYTLKNRTLFLSDASLIFDSLENNNACDP